MAGGGHWPAWAFLARSFLGKVFREELGSQVFSLVPAWGLGVYLPVAPFAQSWSSEIDLPLLLLPTPAGKSCCRGFSSVDLRELDLLGQKSPPDCPSWDVK